MAGEYHKARQARKKGGIRIQPSHEGKLHEAAGVSKDKKIPVAKEEALKAHGTPAERKEATFALNARKWKH